MHRQLLVFRVLAAIIATTFVAPSEVAPFTEQKVFLPFIAKPALPITIELLFEFSEVVQPPGDARQVAVAFHTLTCIDARDNTRGVMRFGTPEANQLQGEGWFDNEDWPGIGKIQWAGGSARRATMRYELPANTEGLLLHVTSIVDGLWMDVSIDGQRAAGMYVDAHWHQVYVPFGAAAPQPIPSAEPEWSAGRYFPSFPTTQQVYAFPLPTTFSDDYGATWDPSWRVNDSHDDMMALTLVAMQGVINRGGPRVYFDWQDYWGNHAFWLELLEQHVYVSHLDLDHLSIMRFLMRRFGNRFKGAVIYDPDVPDTINLATMLAGVEDRVILAPQQLSLPGVQQMLQEMEVRFTVDMNPLALPSLAEFGCATDLRQLAQQQGWSSTFQGQYSLYQWVLAELWPYLEHRIIGVISPGPPTSMTADSPSSYWPLGMASRDWMVALRLPAIYLSPVDEPHAGLFHNYLEQAPSPILISGGVAGYEEQVTALASSHGDWQAALSWPGAILTSANLSVFSGVRPDAVRYPAPIDPDHIWATLGDAPVATMFCTDGDAIMYLMQRGYKESFGWADVRDQRIGWTINPTMAELAPLIWNYYVETRDQASLLTGLSGAGYAYPQLMSPQQLDSYLQHTARYLDDTGLRVVRTDGRKGGPTVDLAGHYYRNLSGHGYLGAIIGYGGPPHGLGFDYFGTPAPVSWPGFTIRSQNEISIAHRILDMTPGDDLIDLDRQHISPDCSIQADPDALNGFAALVPKAFATAPSCCLAVALGPMSLPAGNYVVTFRMKVADTSDSQGFAAIYVGAQPTNWRNIVYRGLAPTDFYQPDRYQEFDLSFTLDRLMPEVEVCIDYFRGSTDLYVDSIRVVRSEGPALPIFANVLIALMLDPSEFEFQTRAPERFTTAFESGGGTVLTVDEFLAALNPEFMIDWATPILGAGHPALIEAQALLDQERFLDSLCTVREALKALRQ